MNKITLPMHTLNRSLPALLFAALLPWQTRAFAQALDCASTKPTIDWMVNPSSFKAQIQASVDGKELVLTNGLARRVIRLGPSATTIDLQNITSGEHLLRSLSPEARVTLNGMDYPIGGLTGMPVQNYFKPAWLDSLKPMPNAYQFADWKELPVSERLKWKKRPEWLSRDLPWPPLGKHVVMRYTPPKDAAWLQSEGKAVFKETFGAFRQPDAGWQIHLTKADANSNFSTEGKAGEITAPANTCVYAQRPWPKSAVWAEVDLDAGDDESSNAWGPGMAVVATDGSVLYFIIRPSQQVFETNAGITGKIDRTKPVRLRMRLQGDQCICEAAAKDGHYQSVAKLPFNGKTPAFLRVGKVGSAGNGQDFAGSPGKSTRTRINEVVLRAKAAPDAPRPTAQLPEIDIHYELFDGIPLFSKWMVVRNQTKATVRVNRFVGDELRLMEAEARNGDVHGPGSERERPNIYVETDMAFGSRMYAAADNHAVKLEGDPRYPNHVNYSYAPPTLLTVAPRVFYLGFSGIDPTGKDDKLVGPDQDVAADGTFESFRIFELLLDSTERERRTLAQRKMYRIIAPWTQENPLMFHKVRSDPKSVRAAIDQAAEVGFEIVVMSFGSGFNFESRDKKYWDIYKNLADYGKSKGIVLGGYSLLASRKAGDGTNIKGKAMYGVMPCLGAKWGQDYLDNILAFAKYAGMGSFENDGSYPGEPCAATNHPFHHGYNDSQWVMWRAITKQYKAMRAMGVFLDVPAWYHLSGANKCSMGYRETNWSLPRAEQEIIERQNMFDGTWTKTQTMGWMFVPLSQYLGGGAAATIEPLYKHLPHYEARLSNLLGYGVQACYRGPRLYDTDDTKALVKKWVTFYKKHREVLDMGDIIHLRRPNGQDWDGILHVNPEGKEKGMAVFYNPLTTPIVREIRVPLYYTGLRGSAQVSIHDEAAQTVTLDGEQSVTLKIKIPAAGRTWVLFTDGPVR